MEHFYQEIEGWFDFQDIYQEMVKKVISHGHFVEVGAFLGKSTSFLGVEIINSHKSIKLDVIDTFQGTPDTINILLSKMKGPDMFQQFKENTRPIQDVINILVLSSVEAALLYKNESLDFVFIDADHTYESVLLDAQAWLPKIKRGGYLGGHDYHRDWPGVIKAVEELFSEKKQIRKNSWLVTTPHNATLQSCHVQLSHFHTKKPNILPV
jgi:hypothetical protein